MEENKDEKKRRYLSPTERWMDFDMDWPMRFAFGGGFPTVSNLMKAVRSPTVDLVDNVDSFTVKADMPGVDKKNIKLKVTKDAMSISAERNEEKELKGKNYYSRERSSMGYYRELPFPEEVKSDSAKARYEDGILTIEIKKVSPKAAPTDVKIE
ncbi:MAG: Hsp20/alpha crystallin family protein [Candidatus Micrarchaeota archaeon]|nr:Hsp20/alpha crystallin family protein [Candidatus Micrarchaeota archaeon]